MTLSSFTLEHETIAIGRCKSYVWDDPPPVGVVDIRRDVGVDNDATELTGDHIKAMLEGTSDITLAHVPHPAELPPPTHPFPLSLPFPNSVTIAWTTDASNDDRILLDNLTFEELMACPFWGDNGQLHPRLLNLWKETPACLYDKPWPCAKRSFVEEAVAAEVVDNEEMSEEDDVLIAILHDDEETSQEEMALEDPEELRPGKRKRIQKVPFVISHTTRKSMSEDGCNLPAFLKIVNLFKDKKSVILLLAIQNSLADIVGVPLKTHLEDKVEPPKGWSPCRGIDDCVEPGEEAERVGVGVHHVGTGHTVDPKMSGYSYALGSYCISLLFAMAKTQDFKDLCHDDACDTMMEMCKTFG